MLTRVTLGFIVCAVLTTQAGAQKNEPSPKNAKTRESSMQLDQLQPIDFSRLVRSLRNANKQPRIVGGWNVRFDPGYDFAEQRRIHKAIRALTIYTEEAWGELVKNLDDNNYSYTFGFGESTRNYSVGQVCEQLIRNALSASYDDRVALLIGTGLSSSDLQNPKTRDLVKLKEWLKSRENISLVEAQIETLEELSLRLSSLKSNDDTKKASFCESISEARVRFSELKVPKLGSSFIPHKEQWFYLNERDAKK